MWFKRQKTIALPIDVTIELPRTADGHRLDEMVVCFDCGILVLKDKAKEVEQRYSSTRYYGGRWNTIEIETPPHMRWYCPTHTPTWDVVHHDSTKPTNYPHGCSYYRRIPTVPERLEEIVEAPVKVARKRKPKKGAK